MPKQIICVVLFESITISHAQRLAAPIELQLMRTKNVYLLLNYDCNTTCGGGGSGSRLETFFFIYPTDSLVWLNLI